MKIIFLHHSTGANLIKEGNVRSLLKEKFPEAEFWDHSYNLEYLKILRITKKYRTGLTDDKGNITGIDYHIVSNDTDPEGLYYLLSQDLTNPPINALSKLLQYDCIILKSCFPVTRILNDEMLETYKRYCVSNKDTFKQFANKKFILFTPPPLRSSLTKPEYANRAREFSNWMKSPDYLENLNNVFVFDFFDLLSEGNSSKKNFNMLKEEYCRIFWLDSHPNKKANEIIGPKFVEFICKVLK